MAVTAVTPRVRSIIICDDILTSTTAENVFTLEGVRLHVRTAILPVVAELYFFMILSSARHGNYAGKIPLVDQQTEKLTRYVKFHARFDAANEMTPLYVPIGKCVFLTAGVYNFEVYFSAPTGGEALKGEQPFYVLFDEE